MSSNLSPHVFYGFLQSALSVRKAVASVDTRAYDPVVFEATASQLLDSYRGDLENREIAVLGINPSPDVLSSSLLISISPGPPSTAPLAQNLSVSLLDRGLNPWTEEGGLPASVKTAIICGADQFLERSLSLPGAPSLPSFLSTHLRPGQDVLSVLAKSPQGFLVLKRILPGFKVHDTGLLARALKVATPDVVSAFGDSASLLSEGQKKSIQRAWSRRLGDGELDQNTLSAMLSSLSSQSLPKSIEATTQSLALSSQIMKLACHPWADGRNLSFSLGSAAGLGLSTAVAKINIPSGPMAGNWSGLSAASMYLLRCTKHQGVYPYQFSGLLGAGEMLTDGCLSSALGVQWRPGIENDGMVWLAMQGREDNGPKHGKVLTDFCSYTGVLDYNAWEVTAMDHARRFTMEVLSRRNSQKAAPALAYAWKNSLGHPSARQVAQSWDVNKKIELARSLSFNYSTVNNFMGSLRSSAVSVFESLFPDISDLALSADRLPVSDPMLPPALTYLLLRVTPILAHKQRCGDIISSDGLEQSAFAFAHNAIIDRILASDPGTFPASMVEDLKAWSKACADNSVLEGEAALIHGKVASWCRASFLKYCASPTPPDHLVRRAF